MDKRRSLKWTQKIIKCKKIADEPPLNKDGYWKKLKKEDIQVNK